MSKGSSADDDYRHIAFEQFLKDVASKVGFTPDQMERGYVWRVPHYEAVITRLGEDTMRLDLYVNGDQLRDAMLSAPMPAIVELWSGMIIELLHSPNAPRAAPSAHYKADEERIFSWQRKMQRIQQHVYRLMDHRRWSQVYDAVIAANPLLVETNPMIRYLRSVYADFAVLAVRRQARPHKDSVSLFGLMREIEGAPKAITREWYRRLWRGETKSEYRQLGMMGPFVERDADNVYAEFADTEGERLSGTCIADDIWSLSHDTESIVYFSDNVVAHDGAQGYRVDKYGTISRHDLDLAVLTVEHFTRRYSQLLLGIVPRNMTPIDLGSAHSVLRLPWIENDAIAEEIHRRFDPWNRVG